MRYAFIRDNQHIWPIRRLCSTLDVHHSGYYAWLKQPISKTAQKRQQLSGLIKQFWLGSGGVAESFFQLLKRERIKKKLYASRTEARSDIFEYIE